MGGLGGQGGNAGNGGSGNGGAVARIAGSLTLNEVTLVDNSALGGVGATGGDSGKGASGGNAGPGGGAGNGGNGGAAGGHGGFALSPGGAGGNGGNGGLRGAGFPVNGGPGGYSFQGGQGGNGGDATGTIFGQVAIGAGTSLTSEGTMTAGTAGLGGHGGDIGFGGGGSLGGDNGFAGTGGPGGGNGAPDGVPGIFDPTPMPSGGSGLNGYGFPPGPFGPDGHAGHIHHTTITQPVHHHISFLVAGGNLELVDDDNSSMVLDSQPVGEIGTFYVGLSGGGNTITVQASALAVGFAANISGAQSTDTVNIDDQTDTTFTIATVNTGEFTQTTAFGSAPTYTDFRSPGSGILNVNSGSNSNDVLRVDSTAAGTSTTITAGGAGQAISVGEGALPLSNVAGAVTVNGLLNGSRELDVGDYPTVYESTTCTVTNNAIGLAANPIHYANIQTLTLASSSGQAINVQSTLSNTSTTIYVLSWYTTVNVGDASHPLSGIAGAVQIYGVQGDYGYTTLNVVDSGNTSMFSTTYTVTNNSVQGGGSALIGYTYIQSLNLNTNSAADAVNVLSTSSATAFTTVNAGAANTSVYVGSNPHLSPSTSTLDAIQGNLQVNGVSNGGSVSFFDGGSASHHTYNFATASVQFAGVQLQRFTGSSGGPLMAFSNVGLVTLNAGKVANTISAGTMGTSGTVLNLGALNLTINGGAGGDTMNLNVTGSGTVNAIGHSTASTSDVFNVQGTTTYHTNLTGGEGNDYMTIGAVTENVVNIYGLINVTSNATSGHIATLFVDDTLGWDPLSAGPNQPLTDSEGHFTVSYSGSNIAASYRNYLYGSITPF